MTYHDYLLILCSLLAVIAGWRRSQIGMCIAVILICVSAAWAVFDNRWQSAAGFSVALIAFVVLILRAYKSNASKPISTESVYQKPLHQKPLHQKPLHQKPWLSTLLLAVSTGLVAWLAYSFPTHQLPKPTGPDAVGFREFELFDQDRVGIFSADANEPRRLLVKVWYPAAALTAKQKLKPYFSQAEADHTSQGLGRGFGADFLLQYLKHASTHSHVNADIKASQTPYPTILFSHGYTSYAAQNTALMEDLASHGYVIYSIHHTYDGAPVVFPNGDVTDMDAGAAQVPQDTDQAQQDADQMAVLFSQDLSLRQTALQNYWQTLKRTNARIANGSAKVWVEDRLFVHDQLQQGKVPQHVKVIVDNSNLARTGQIGMSFGGSTTGAICTIDPRCAAGINLDGFSYHDATINTNVPVPFMMMYSDLRLIAQMVGGEASDTMPYGFNDFSYERFDSAGLRSDLHRFIVTDVTHLGYSDLTWFVRNPMKELMLGPISGDTMLSLQNRFVRGFFDKYIRGYNNDFPTPELKEFTAHVSQDTTHRVREWWATQVPQDLTKGVRIETSLGAIEVALYPNRAPVAVEQFLNYVTNGHYNTNASFYRATTKQNSQGITVVQGGLLQATMSGDGAEYEQPMLPLPPIAHETTEQTGMSNLYGTLAYARLTPGSANSEFFFNLDDNLVLDTGNTNRGRDGHGYTTFGRVISGMHVLRAIHEAPRNGVTGIDAVKGQILSEPVMITGMQVIEP